MRLAEHTTTTAADALEDVSVAVLPTGAVEQHGPALPLGTDVTVAEALAGAVADREDVAVLPPVPVGVSEHHRQFHGTLWVDPGTFEDYVADVLRSVTTHGVRRAVAVNGHGGNTGALNRVARRLRGQGRETDGGEAGGGAVGGGGGPGAPGEFRAFLAPWNWWDPPAVSAVAEEEFDAPLGHADAQETSVVMEVAGELVRREALAEAEAGAADGWGREVHGAEVGFDTADFSESGAVGAPTEASEEAGERLFEAAVDELEDLIDWLGTRSAGDLRPRDHR